MKKRQPRAVGYTRVSTSEQRQSGLGLDAQEQAIRAAAASLGVELGALHTDAGVSGGKGLEQRPGLLAAVGDLRRGDVLMVAKRDRLGRDLLVTAMVERLVRRRGARIVSAAGEGTQADPDDPTSFLVRRLMDLLAEYEKLLIGARTRAALQAKKARGERVGEVPFGFRADAEGRLIPHEGEQQIMTAVEEARRRGLSQRAIVAELRARGFVSRSGKPLGRSQVRNILTRLADAA